MKLSGTVAAFLLLSALPPCPAQAGEAPAYRVRNLEPGRRSPDVYPESVAELDGRLYFLGSTGITGRELFRTDGTRQGTKLVADLCQGRCSAFFPGWPAPSVEHAGSLYLSACDALGCPLWKLGDGEAVAIYDGGGGAVDGPRQVVTHLAAWNGALYFTTSDGELRRTAGDGPGTVLARISGLRVLGPPVTAPDVFFFVAFGFDGGLIDPPIAPPPQLWRSDGTAAGTFLLADSLWVDSDYPAPYLVGGRAVFQAFVNGKASLLASDGDTVEPFFEDPPYGPLVEVLLADDGVLYLGTAADARGREIWRTDGTAAGTALVTGISGSYVVPTVYRDELYFFEWVNPTVLLKVPQGSTAAVRFFEFPAAITRLKVAGDVLYAALGARSQYVADRLWQSRGTADSTSQVFSLTDDLAFELLALLDGDPVVRLERPGDCAIRYQDGWRPLCSSLARVTGAGELVSLFPDEGLSGDPHGFTPDGDTVLFLAADPDLETGTRLWRSDGTAAGTRRVAEVAESSRLVPLGDRVLLFEGTRIVALERTGRPALVALPASGFQILPQTAYPLDGAALVLYLVRHEESLAVDLWRTDGTPGGTSLVRPALDRLPEWIESVAGVTLDSALLLVAEKTVWRTDGTAAGTVRLLDFEESCYQCSFANPVRAGDRVYFTSREQSRVDVERLWRTDGTTAGTAVVRAFRGPAEGAVWGSQAPALRELVAVGDRLFFVVADASVGNLPVPPEPRVAAGTELWTSDGTRGGTRRVRNVWRGRSSSSPQWLTEFGGRLLFTADDGVAGRELWTSDGTAAGTALFRDLRPGPASSQPHHLRVVDGVLLFAADGGEAGSELWASDPDGTVVKQLQDLYPGPRSSDPRDFTAAGGRIFFNAGRRGAGFELWALDRAELDSVRPSAAP